MPEAGFNLAPLFPHSIEIVVEDAARVFLPLRGQDWHLSLSMPFADGSRAFTGSFWLSDVHDLPSLAPLRHDIARTAAEVMIAAEGAKRLEIYLIDTIRRLLQDETSNIEKAISGQDDIIRYFDLRNQSWNDVYLLPAFDVIEISLDSPTRTRIKIRDLIMIVNLMAPLPLPPTVAVATPPVSSAAVGTIIAAVSAAVSAASLGYTIYVDRRDNDLEDQQNFIYQRLLKDVHQGNYRGVQSYLGTLGYYAGRIDNIVGPHTEAARKHFAFNYGLNPNIEIDHPAFLLRLSQEVTKL